MSASKTAGAQLLRSAIMFSSASELRIYKAAVADAAALDGHSASEEVSRLVINRLAQTPVGRTAAKLLYNDPNLDLMAAYMRMFERLIAYGQDKDHALGVARAFYDYAQASQAVTTIDGQTERQSTSALVSEILSGWDEIEQKTAISSLMDIALHSLPTLHDDDIEHEARMAYIKAVDENQQ